MAERSEGGSPPRQRRLVNPRTWPVRWRLAAASAGLTLAILLIFAAVIGHLATQRIRNDFDQEMHGAVTTLANRVQVIQTPSGLLVKNPELDDFALPNGAAVRIFDTAGHLQEQTHHAPELGPPEPGVAHVGALRVITARVVSSGGNVVGYVQYARSEEHVNDTITRLWLFIAAGVVGAVLLACLAGLTIANRAMQPIASLTAAAGEIASTRDPSRRMPQPDVDDEVGELARTLEQMLRSLDAARAEREQAMQKQREFVADASHELRTPLTSVIANLELLQTSLEQPRENEDREMVDSALRSSRRMSRLVADLLLLARADAGRFSERTDCDLAEIVGAAAAEVAPMVRGRNLKVENGRPVPLLGNPDELHRMVVNLLDNAVRYTPEGSTIDLRLQTEGDRAIVEVADDGPGIPEGLREQVFDRFVRGTGPADTAAGGGTGLGLAIVRAVANSHGGKVEASPSPRGGALFTVTLPLGKTEQGITTPLETLYSALFICNPDETHGFAGDLPLSTSAGPPSADRSKQPPGSPLPRARRLSFSCDLPPEQPSGTAPAGRVATRLAPRRNRPALRGSP
jgi:two-component system OmpR family sensor kinase